MCLCCVCPCACLCLQGCAYRIRVISEYGGYFGIGEFRRHHAQPVLNELSNPERTVRRTVYALIMCVSCVSCVCLPTVYGVSVLVCVA